MPEITSTIQNTKHETTKINNRHAVMTTEQMAATAKVWPYTYYKYGAKQLKWDKAKKVSTYAKVGKYRLILVIVIKFLLLAQTLIIIIEFHL
jgi:hypothetical protein